MGWNKEGASNLAKRIKKVDKRLHNAQKEGISERNCKKCGDLEKELDGLNEKLEAH